MVSYGPNSADLAIADSKGNVTIVITGVAKPSTPSRLLLVLASLNELETVYRDSVSNDVNLQLIAFNWLPVDKPLIVNGPASRVSISGTQLTNGAAASFGAAFEDSSDHLYQYSVAQHKPVGPSHPIPTKQACVAVRKNGRVDVWYQGEHGLEYSKVSGVLEPELLSLDFSKALIGFTRDLKIVVALYSQLEAVLKIYTISVDWGYLTHSSQMQKKMPNFVTPELSKTKPSLKIEKFLRSNISDINLTTGQSQLLKILEVISPNHIQTTELEIVLGFETKVEDRTVSSLQVMSIDTNSVAKLFGNLSSSSSPFTGTTLKTRSTVDCPDLLLSIKPAFYGNFIVLAYQNGKIEVLDRNTLVYIQNQFDDKNSNMSFNNPTSLDQNTLELPTHLRCLIDAGFQFPEMHFNPSFVLVSPILSSYVAMDQKTGQLVWKSLVRDSDAMVVKNQKTFKKGFLILTASAFAYTHTAACFRQAFTGDLVTTIQLEVERIKKIQGDDEYAQKLILLILEECQRSINFQLDYTRESADKLLNHPPFQKLMSLQLSLGTSMNWSRDKSARISYNLLQLRLCSLIITLSLRGIFQQIQKESSGNRSNSLDETYVKSNTVLSAIGYVRWFVDFCVSMNQELIEMGELLSSNPQKKREIMGSYITTPLLLNTISRSLLLYSIAGIKKLNDYSTKSVESLDLSFFKNFAIQESFERLNLIIKSSPIRLESFEKFIIDIDNSLRSMKDDKAASIQNETQLLCQGKIPQSYVEHMSNMYWQYSTVADREFNQEELYFYDVSWLNPNMAIGEEKVVTVIEETSTENHKLLLRFKKKKNSLFVDELRKNLITSMSLRRCIMCGAVSSCDEIPLYDVNFISATILPFQRNCFCGGFWVTL